MSHLRFALGHIFIGLLLVPLGSSLVVAQPPPLTLGQPGYLVIEGVRDSLSEFSWREGVRPSRRALVWPEGTMTWPDSLSLDDFGRSDVGIVCRAELSGVGNSGRLIFADGVYPVSEPLLLADGVVELHVSGGELEVRGSQIRYRRPQIVDNSQKANWVFLCGLILLIIVLMRRARKKMRAS